MPETPEDLLQELERIVRWNPNAVVSSSVSTDTLDGAQQQLSQLERQRTELKAQIVAAEATSRVAFETSTELREQAARLTSANLYPANQAEITCPLCEQPTGSAQVAIPRFQAVREQFASTTAQLAELETYLPNMTEYLAGLRDELRRADSSIATTRQTIRQLFSEQDQNNAILNLTVRQAVIVGRIEQYLAAMRDQLGAGAKLRGGVTAAKQRVAELQSGINAYEIKRRLQSIADQLQANMTTWASELRLEFAPDPFRINFEQLTVEVSRNGYHLPLHRMGSGKNWLGCHLIAHFALHSFFIQNRRPVPRFLFLDQPTQVFYPPDEVDRAGGETENLTLREANSSEDRDIVQRLFAWIFERTAELNAAGPFQVIVTDHAELRTPQFTAALIDPPRWREGVNGLVPPGWLSTPDT